MADYSQDDVEAVARAVIEFAHLNDESGKTAYATCRYCDRRWHIEWLKGDQFAFDQIKHSGLCPYLISKDLLTGCLTLERDQ